MTANELFKRFIEVMSKYFDALKCVKERNIALYMEQYTIYDNMFGKLVEDCNIDTGNVREDVNEFYKLLDNNNIDHVEIWKMVFELAKDKLDYDRFGEDDEVREEYRMIWANIVLGIESDCAGNA